MLAAAAALAAEGAPARLVRVEGLVAVRAPSGAGAPAAAGTTLALGSTVATGPGSSATIELADGTRVDLGSETTVAVSSPKRTSLVTLKARDGSEQAVSPGERLLLAWPKSGNPEARRDGGPDFTLVVEGAEPACRPPEEPDDSAPRREPPEPLKPPYTTRRPEPLLPPHEAPPEREAVVRTADDVLEIEIIGDAPPKVTRKARR